MMWHLVCDLKETGKYNKMDNCTMIREFHLMGISGSREFQVMQGVFFLVIYLGSLIGNLVTIAVIMTSHCLHSPMYFFISNLSLIDLCSISVIVPKSIINSFMDSNSISLKECTAQVFLYVFFAFTELALLVVMSYDRYVAICHPLHYGLVITPSLCIQAVGGSWASGLAYSAVHTVTMFRLPFTKSNEIHQYFCEVSQILRISSSDVQFSESVVLVLSVCVIIVCFAFLLMTYVNIFSTVLKIHLLEARHKAMSTCVPQLAILLLFLISGLVASLDPIANKGSLKNLLTAMFYTMVPPFINPIIYSLRNTEINFAIGDMFKRCFQL
ncbi:Olfactory receptor 14I1 [Fukomys damarensis]|uniref:Olfactory receptor n=1 Tax=Fukomys damarensis TaxID=885580 RepID=A0A091EJT5_FUKDA|nr:Olfactory receptor 14I1 [Fukomys damarensis]